MHILRIEHEVPDFEEWKKAFDGDPVDREHSGVRRHVITRAVDNPNNVSIDLEFATEVEAAALLAALRALWARVEGQIIMQPHARVVRVTEDCAY